MALNRYFNTSFWKDNYIVDLDPIEKLLFNYLFTNAKVNISGVYEIHIKEIAFDTGLDKEMALKVVKRFEADKKILYYEGWIILTNALKHQKFNPNIKIGVQKQYEALPDDIRKMVLEIWTRKGFKSELDWLPDSDVEPEEQPEEIKTQTVEKKKPNADLGPTLIALNQLLGGTKNIKVTEGRKSKLRSRLKSFTLEEIVEAAEIIGADEFMQGKNDNSVKYATIDYLIRKDEIIAMYLERGKPKEKRKIRF